MADMLHEITIAAPPAGIYDALTTQDGLRGWWTADSEARPEVGSVALFGFDDRAIVFRMRIDALVPEWRVAWTCLGDVDEWRNTGLSFTLEGAEDGKTRLRFSHIGWRSTHGWFALCNTTWGALLHRLRDHAEGRAPGPLFSGRA